MNRFYIYGIVILSFFAIEGIIRKLRPDDGDQLVGHFRLLRRIVLGVLVVGYMFFIHGKHG